MMASDDRLKHIPVIILTGHSDRETVERVRDLGARYVLKSADIWSQIEALICQLLDTQKPQVAINREQ